MIWRVARSHENSQDVMPKMSMPPLRAIKKGMKPAVDQSLSKIAYLFAVEVLFVEDSFLLEMYDAEIEHAREATLRT